jgi:NAD(P)-dependent dehydrogenase (short-subunit alcohol dehydrogenase family)
MLSGAEYVIGNGDAKVIAVECDVASQESVQNAYARVIDAFHRVDSVVASAGEYSAKLYCAVAKICDLKASSRTSPL